MAEETETLSSPEAKETKAAPEVTRIESVRAPEPEPETAAAGPESEAAPMTVHDVLRLVRTETDTERALNKAAIEDLRKAILKVGADVLEQVRKSEANILNALPKSEQEK
jgi:hypothetical protein